MANALSSCKTKNSFVMMDNVMMAKTSQSPKNPTRYPEQFKEDWIRRTSNVSDCL